MATHADNSRAVALLLAAGARLSQGVQQAPVATSEAPGAGLRVALAASPRFGGDRRRSSMDAAAPFAGLRVAGTASQLRRGCVSQPRLL